MSETAPTIIGLDLSLTATGIACNQAEGWATTIYPGARKGHERLEFIRRAMVQHIPQTVFDLDHVYAVVESPAWGALGNTYHQLAGQWWLMTHTLYRRGIPTALVNPGTLKSYATNNGRASKDEMRAEVVARFPNFRGDHNAADALALCAMGAEHFGQTLGAYGFPNPAALARVEWPDPAGVLNA